MDGAWQPLWGPTGNSVGEPTGVIMGIGHHYVEPGAARKGLSHTKPGSHALAPCRWRARPDYLLRP